MFFVYILECADGSFYVGQTKNLILRLRAHEAGTASTHTRKRRPVRLVYSELQRSREAAAQRERQLKGWTHRKKEALVDGDLASLRVLSRSGGRRSRED
jgi:predicted GIY-YIG superfamily endonuclease